MIIQEADIFSLLFFALLEVIRKLKIWMIVIESSFKEISKL
jgi:hypothetical protein